MSATVSFDDSEAREWLKNAPPALVKAAIAGLHRTQEESLIAGKREIMSRFTDRTPLFLKTIPTGQPGSPIPRHWRANPQGSPISALVAIGDGGGKRFGDRRRDILEPFETGKAKKAKDMPVFIPTKALRSSMSQSIPKAMLPHILLGKFNKDGKLVGLKSSRARRTKLGGKRARALYSYFTINKPGQSKANGIYERFGPKKNDVRMIWAFRDEIKRPAMLKWVEVTSAMARKQLEPNIAGIVEAAIRKLNAQGRAA